jgi:hypothetical protein
MMVDGILARLLSIKDALLTIPNDLYVNEKKDCPASDADCALLD